VGAAKAGIRRVVVIVRGVYKVIRELIFVEGFESPTLACLQFLEKSQGRKRRQE
jgi:hypothetical protein